MKIRALVVDDEPIARLSIVRLLREDEDFGAVEECGDGASAIERIARDAPDLVFLDIQMPALTGLDVVALIGAERMPPAVFVTAYEQYAVRAFEADAIDYLVKPFGHERFLKTLQRAKARLAAGPLDAGAAVQIKRLLERLRDREDYLERIAVRTGEHVALVDVDEIVWIKANRNTVELHLADRTHELRETMTALAAKLDPKRFARVHRSAIVNLERVKTIHPWFNGYHVLVMDTGQKLRMSRYQQESLLKLIGRG